MRRQYRKIVWSVGIVEKAILRWRLKRKGFRGLQVAPAEVTEDQETGMEEDFYRVSQKQAEERVERAVIRVQAMFRSKKVQEEYRRMKLTHAEAAVSYNPLIEVSCVSSGCLNFDFVFFLSYFSWNMKSFHILI